MSGNGKTYGAALEKVDRSQRYPLEDSLRLAKETARAKFDELRYLERSIGRTGTRAMQPFLHLNSRDLWQIHMLDR